MFRSPGLVNHYWIAKIGEKWLSIGVPPHFSPKTFFAKMTQNEMDFKNKTPPNVTFVTFFFKASLFDTL